MKKSVVCVFLAIIFLTSFVCAENKLVAYYNFQDNMNDNAESNNAQASNINFVLPLGWNGGKVGEFNGINSYASVADNENLRLTAYSVSVWINPNPSKNQWNGIVGKPGRNYHIWYEDGAKFIRQDFCDSSGAISKNFVNTNTNAINVGAWNHVVITNDGTIAKTYINGNLASSNQVNGSLCSPSQKPLIIGKNLDGHTMNNYSGLMDELKIYNYAISSSEVSNEYNRIMSPSCTPKTCFQLGKNCGLYNDGCNNMINCGLCNSGQICNNGVCGPASQTICSDSDGMNYFNSGYITLNKSDGNMETFNDLCNYYGNPNTLGEFYCNSTGYSVQPYECPNGCKNGACVETTATCTDSDGGIVIDVAGFTFVKSNTFELRNNDTCALVDSYNPDGTPGAWQSAYDCSGKNCYIEETFCKPVGDTYDADADQLIACPNGCKDGACVSAPTCTPNWDCRFEPDVCPSHGIQKKICADLNTCTGNYYIEEDQRCTPGECNGCYVPRWYGYDLKYGNSDNVCMPYGARFNFRNSNEEAIKEADYDTWAVKVISASLAILSFKDENGAVTNYNLVPGETVFIQLPKNFENGDKIEISTKDIFVSDNAEASSYVTIIVRHSMNSYCSYDGWIQMQKTSDGSGNWATCQENFECESNVCSSGECIEVAKLMKETGKFKGLFIKALCRITNMFSTDEYNKCLGNFGVEPEVEPTCTDSDGGKDYFVKGVIMGENNIETGREDSETIVLSNEAAKLIINGNEYNVKLNQKYEVIDWGVIYINKIGFVSLGNPKNYVEIIWQEVNDACEDNVTLIERYCDSNNPNAYEEYSCPYGCSNGACLKQPSCTPKCSGKICGNDGCGGSCGTCPGIQNCYNGTQCVDTSGMVCMNWFGNNLNWSNIPVATQKTGGEPWGIMNNNICTEEIVSPYGVYACALYAPNKPYITCPGDCISGACVQ